ncbi:MAG: SOS response-associated peptidase [Leptospiraceae bacterium]|nr:SOS response-associated peptidase [Leptospiraceae bacterium]
MCGRFALIKNLDLLMDEFDINYEKEILESSKEEYTPTDQIIAIYHKSEKNKKMGRRLRWGLLPNFIKNWEQIKNYSLFNARSESLEEKPSFRNLLNTNRCIIPSDVFFEYKSEGKVKDKYAFTLESKSTFAMAGLWDSWINPKTNQEILSCTILTTIANEIVRPVHEKNRMPVILEKEFYEKWLDISIKFSDLKYMLKPFPESKMKSEKIIRTDKLNLPSETQKSSGQFEDTQPSLFGS